MDAVRVMMLTGMILLGGVMGQTRGKTLIWKPVTQALLKKNNRPVKTWNVYQPDKDHVLVLVQVDQNWFIFNLKEKRVYQAERRYFEERNDSLAGPEPDRHSTVVKTDDWDSHNVGPAQQISVRIVTTGDVLAIELPHPLAVY